VFDLLAVYNTGKPNKIHTLLAKMFIERKILRIYTTNQDMYLEYALNEKGWIKNRDYIVILPHHDAITDVKLPAIIKLHGSIDDYQSIRTTLQHVGRGIPFNLEKIFTYDLEKFPFYFLGYSGRDIDIRPVILKAKSKCLYWCERPDINLQAHFIEVLKRNGRNVILDLYDLKNITGSQPENFRQNQNQLKNSYSIIKSKIRQIGVTPTESSYLLGRLYRLGNYRSECDVCIKYAIKNRTNARSQWQFYFFKAERELFEAVLLWGNLKAIFWYLVAIFAALREESKTGLIKAWGRIGTSIDLSFRGEIGILSMLSAALVYLPLKVLMRFRSFSELHELSYENRFNIAKALARTGITRLAIKKLYKLREEKALDRFTGAHVERYLGALLSQIGKNDEADILFTSAIEEFRYRENDIEIADVLRMKAESLANRSQLKEALQTAKEALDIYLKKGQKRGIKKTQKLIHSLEKK